VAEEDQQYSLSTAQMLSRLLEEEEERIALLNTSVVVEVNETTASCVRYYLIFIYTACSRKKVRMNTCTV
jgi:hypothetical protein